MQYEIGDLQEDESMRTCMRYILRVVLAIHTCAAGVIRAVVGADGALEAKRERDSSHRPSFKSSRSGKITIRTAKRAMCAMRASKLCVES